MPRVAAIGAGPAGFTLTAIHQKHKIPVTIFEKERQVIEEHPSTSLDLHPESGQRATREADLWDIFQKYARYDGEDFVLIDKNNKKHLDLQDIDTGRPEIDRGSCVKYFWMLFSPTQSNGARRWLEWRKALFTLISPNLDLILLLAPTGHSQKFDPSSSISRLSIAEFRGSSSGSLTLTRDIPNWPPWLARATFSAMAIQTSKACSYSTMETAVPVSWLWADGL